MAILLIPGKFNAESWVQILHKIDSTLDIEIWPKVADPNAITFAIVWNHPHGELLKYPHLKCISSFGAGVDHILDDTQRPPVPIVRVVDKHLIRDMSQYVIWAALNHARYFDYYAQSNEKHLWTPRSLIELPNIGLMGLGQLGSDAALKFLDLGFKVSSWTRSPKNIEGVQHFVGKEQFGNFLANTHILICLLPFTPETNGILNRETFQQLPSGAYIINVARGGHLVEEDLIHALDTHHLSGACLDVFKKEPLPKNHPFWKHPKIKITPHIASVTDPRSAAAQIVENYHNIQSGQPLLNQVDVEKGY